MIAAANVMQAAAVIAAAQPRLADTLAAGILAVGRRSTRPKNAAMWPSGTRFSRSIGSSRRFHANARG